MIECEHCESLIPEHYSLCPVCGSKLDLTRKIRFRQPNKQTKEVKETHLEIVHSEIEDFMSNESEQSSI